MSADDTVSVEATATATATSFEDVDLLVVGSGLAGLTTALRFSKHTLNPVRVVVLESDKVVGGRTRSMWLKSLPRDVAPKVSYGGTWVMLDNDELVGLSQEIDWMPFQPKLIPNFSKGSLNLTFFEAPYLLLKLWTIGNEIVDAPADKPVHIELDALPLSQWIEDNKHLALNSELAATAVRDWFFQIENYPSDTSQLSTYFAAKSVKIRLSHVTQTGVLVPKIMRWENGTGIVIDRMVQQIHQHGGQVITQHQVQSLKQDDNQVEVVAKNLMNGSNVVYRAKQVVVATALTNASRLNYEPPLPTNLTAITQAMREWDDPDVQVIFAWKTRWWDSEFQGTSVYPEAIPDTQQGVYGPVFDLSEGGPVGGNHSPYGIIRIICKRSRVTDPATNQLWDEERIQQSAFEYLARFHKKHHETTEHAIKRIGKGLLQRVIFDFSTTPDIHAVTFFFTPTEGSIYARHAQYLRTPFNRIHFAGAERAESGFNWMEGAVLTGTQAALEVLRAHYGEQWTKQDSRRFKDKMQEYKSHGLRRLHISDWENIGKYIEAGIQIAFDAVIHWISDLWHKISHPHHLNAAPVHHAALLGSKKLPFRAPETDAEKEVFESFCCACKDHKDGHPSTHVNHESCPPPAAQ